MTTTPANPALPVAEHTFPRDLNDLHDYLLSHTSTLSLTPDQVTCYFAQYPPIPPRILTTISHQDWERAIAMQNALFMRDTLLSIPRGRERPSAGLVRPEHPYTLLNLQNPSHARTAPHPPALDMQVPFANWFRTPNTQALLHSFYDHTAVSNNKTHITRINDVHAAYTNAGQHAVRVLGANVYSRPQHPAPYVYFADVYLFAANPTESAREKIDFILGFKGTEDTSDLFPETIEYMNALIATQTHRKRHPIVVWNFVPNLPHLPHNHLPLPDDHILPNTHNA